MGEPESMELEAGQFVSREDWGSLDPKDELRPLKLPVKYVWYIYDTKSRSCHTYDECVRSMRQMQRRYHETSKLADIPFNFLIGGDGRIYEGRGWDYAPPDSKEWKFTNGERLEIGYLGKKVDDEKEKKFGDGCVICAHNADTVIDKMEQACGALVLTGKGKKYIKENVRHSEFERVGVPSLPYYSDSEEEEDEGVGSAGNASPEAVGDYPDGLEDIPPLDPKDYK